MKVFIIYEKDGYGGSQVNKVFAEESDAVDYMILHEFGSNEFYTNQTRAENRLSALEHIETHTIIRKGGIK